MFCPSCGTKMEDQRPLTERIGYGLIIGISIVLSVIVIMVGISTSIYFHYQYAKHMTELGYVKRTKILVPGSAWVKPRTTTEWVKENKEDSPPKSPRIG